MGEGEDERSVDAVNDSAAGGPNLGGAIIGTGKNDGRGKYVRVNMFAHACGYI